MKDFTDPVRITIIMDVPVCVAYTFYSNYYKATSKNDDSL